MPNINLQIDKKCFAPKFYPLLFDYSHRWECYVGSSGSGKSYFITEKLIIKGLNTKRRILVCRRYGTTIRQTVFNLFKDVLKKFKIIQYCKINESDYRITFPNGTEIIFLGLDEETKLLSLSNISDVFIEEVYEVSRDIVEQLNLRMRGNAANQQIFMAYNPISKKHWLYNFVEENPPESFLKSHSTFRDNPFLSQAYIDALLDLYRTNPVKARVFCDGEYGVNPDGLVIKNWRTEDFDPMALAAKGFEHRCGCDLGWIDKTAVIDTLYNRENKTIYVFNEFYKSGCQLSELVQAIKQMNLDRTKIQFDSAEPRTIDYMKSQGIRAVPCIKGKDSVNARIAFLQDNTIIVLPRCKAFINELENFSYIKSKQTGEYTNDTTHEFSHAIDACGYAYSDIYTQTKLKSININLF